MTMANPSQRNTKLVVWTLLVAYVFLTAPTTNALNLRDPSTTVSKDSLVSKENVRPSYGPL